MTGADGILVGGFQGQLLGCLNIYYKWTSNNLLTLLGTGNGALYRLELEELFARLSRRETRWRMRVQRWKNPPARLRTRKLPLRYPWTWTWCRSTSLRVGDPQRYPWTAMKSRRLRTRPPRRMSHKASHYRQRALSVKLNSICLSEGLEMAKRKFASELLSQTGWQKHDSTLGHFYIRETAS